MCLFICLFIATQNFYYTYANGSETQGLKQFSKLENNLKGGKDYLENELLPNITCNVLFLLSVCSVTWNHNCIPGSLPDNELNLYELYEGVETFLMFIGYPRSSHSLMGAILDAHPHIVISHEYHIVNRWSIYQDDTLINTGMQKYLLFYNLHSLSTWQAVFGNRAKKPVFLDDGIYSYNVPGAWQGTFSGKIKVSTNAFIFYLFFFQLLVKCIVFIS